MLSEILVILSEAKDLLFDATAGSSLRSE